MTEPPEDQDGEWDEVFDADEDEEWEDQSTPDRGLVIFARVVTAILAAGSIGLFGWMSMAARGIGDWVGLVVLGLVVGFWVKRVLMMAYLEA